MSITQNKREQQWELELALVVNGSQEKILFLKQVQVLGEDLEMKKITTMKTEEIILRAKECSELVTDFRKFEKNIE